MLLAEERVRDEHHRMSLVRTRRKWFSRKNNDATSWQNDEHN